MLNIEWLNFKKESARLSNIRDIALGVNDTPYILLFSGSYGDVYLSFALLAAFEKYHGERPVVICSERYKLLALRFSKFCKNILLVPDAQALHPLIMKESKNLALLKGEIYPTLPTLHPLLVEAHLYMGLHDHDIRRLIMGLPQAAEFDNHALNEERLREVRHMFDKHGCKIGRTVVISPESNTHSRMSQNLLHSVVAKVAEYGFDVLINVASSFSNEVTTHGLVSPERHIQIPADAPVEYTEFAGYHICGWNGLSASILTKFSHSLRSLILVNTDTDGNVPSAMGSLSKSYYDPKLYLGPHQNPSNFAIDFFCGDNYNTAILKLDEILATQN